MVKITFIMILSALLFFTPEVNAQKKSDDLNQSIQNIAHALGDIFHKKKSTDTSETNIDHQGIFNGKDNPSIPKGNAFLPKLGQQAPDAKAIVADMMYPFNGGAAIINKGSSYALIDSAGNFIEPYNRYRFLPAKGPGSLANGYFTKTGIFHIVTDNGGGFINARGKVLTNAANWQDFKLNPFQTYLVADKRAPNKYNHGNGVAQDIQTFIAPDGSTYQFLHDDGSPCTISEGIVLIKDGGSYFYSTLSGKRITHEHFDIANNFSDGMALVGKKNQFGEVKYGYINTEGKLAIPFMFSNAPGFFSQGFARVEPQDKSSFEYAYINKKGEVVFKQTSADESKYGIFKDFQSYGMAYSGNYFLTTDFKIISMKDFFKSHGAPEDSHIATYNNLSNMYNPKSPKIFFTSSHFIEPVTKHGGVLGFINLATGKTVLPVFSSITPFDPVSNLAYAEVITGLDKNRMVILKKGYVNEDGLFVLVQKGEESKW